MWRICKHNMLPFEQARYYSFFDVYKLQLLSHCYTIYRGGRTIQGKTRGVIEVTQLVSSKVYVVGTLSCTNPSIAMGIPPKPRIVPARTLTFVSRRSSTPKGTMLNVASAPCGKKTLLIVPEFALPRMGTTSGVANVWLNVAKTVPLSPAVLVMLSMVSSIINGLVTVKLIETRLVVRESRVMIVLISFTIPRPSALMISPMVNPPSEDDESDTGALIHSAGKLLHTSKRISTSMTTVLLSR